LAFAGIFDAIRGTCAISCKELMNIHVETREPWKIARKRDTIIAMQINETQRWPIDSILEALLLAIRGGSFQSNFYPKFTCLLLFDLSMPFASLKVICREL